MRKLQLQGDRTEGAAIASPSSGSKGVDRAWRQRVAQALMASFAVCALLGVGASRADAAFGDLFGFEPINQSGAQSAPAFPGTDAVWAGTCDTGAAPVGDPIPGGVGSRPPSVWEPEPIIGASSFPSGAQIEIPAPEFPDQCIDWGRLAPHGQPDYPQLWRDPADWPGDPAPPGVDPWGPAGGGPPSWRLAPVTQAGAHPDATATMWFRRGTEGNARGSIDGSVDNVYAQLPAGFVGDPTAVPKCTAEQFAVKPVQCPPESQVGVLHLYLVAAFGAANYPNSNEEIVPVYNLEPRHRRVAELGAAFLSGENAVTARIVAKARTNGDYGVDTFVAQLPASLPLIAQSITLWGVPWSSAHDLWRPPEGWRSSTSGTGEISPSGLDPSDRVAYVPSWGRIRPFISNPTECAGVELTTRVLTDSYQQPGAFNQWGDPVRGDSQWRTYDVPAPPVTGCEKVPFEPGIGLAPTSQLADSPTGLVADLVIPQNKGPPVSLENDPDHAIGAPAFWRSDDGLATSHLDKAVVTLPEGMSVNPSGADGLHACTDAQMGVTDATTSPMLFDNDDPFDGKGAECPEGSEVGTVEIETPLLDAPLTGDVVLGEPREVDHDNNVATPPRFDPESGQMLRLFIVARDEERGLVAKIYGTSIADKDTGRLTATFDKNPRVPFEAMHLRFKGGDRATLATPRRCASAPWSALFTPWTAAHGAGGVPKPDTGSFTIDQRCHNSFAPALTAGMTGRQATSSGTFTFELRRPDGQQWLRGLSAKVPQGLLASVKNVPLCGNAQANANACPISSKIGKVDAGAGAGLPFFLEKPGSVYLTEGYKGAPYGLSVSVPVEAGPFRGKLALDPIVVRQALRVDPNTAQVTAESDPLPQIWQGIPLRVRQVTVKIDRPGFMRNPTDCSTKQTVANLTSVDGASASVSSPFNATGCSKLGFKPKLSLALTGKRQTKYRGHPGINARLTQPAGQANIEATTVRLPRALALDIDRAQSDSLCDWEESLKDDPKCPSSSIIGRAKAVSPLLKRPLEGPVYFAKRKRINEFGRAISTFPSLIVALRGEIALNVRANTDVKPGKLISTFPAIPDAPVSRFEMKLSGGNKGILLVTKDRSGKKLNICGKQVAEVDMEAHNGRQRDTGVRMKTPCKKKPRRKSKRRS